MSEWTHDPWHDKYFRPDPKYYYSTREKAELEALESKLRNWHIIEARLR